MAYIRCESGGTAPQISVTTLWTTPDPNQIFNSQTITLSDNWDNYDLIKVQYMPMRESTIGNVSSVLYETSEMSNWQQKWDSNDRSIRDCGGLTGMVHHESGGSAQGVRFIRTYDGTTALAKNKLFFTASVRTGGTNETYFNRYLVPIKVEGIKLSTPI